MPDIEQTINAVLAEDEEPAVIVIYRTDGQAYRATDGSEVTMSVLGQESKAVKAAQDRSVRRYARSRRGARDEAQIARETRIEIATAAVVGWHGWEIDGQPAPLTPENLGRVLRADHILQQVEEAIHEHARFFKHSSAS